MQTFYVPFESREEFPLRGRGSELFLVVSKQFQIGNDLRVIKIGGNRRTIKMCPCSL